MTALSEDLAPTETAQDSIKSSPQAQTREQIIQSQKDRTLFCINIDQNCTEDILYELFLQVTSKSKKNKSIKKMKSDILLGGADR